MNKRFRVCDLDLQFLLPPSLQDWLPENHLARFIADVTNELDLAPIYAQYGRKDGRGLSAYHPLLLALAVRAAPRCAAWKFRSARPFWMALYERIGERVHFAMNPKLAANRIVCDLELAQLDAVGEVECAGISIFCTPPTRRRGTERCCLKFPIAAGKGMLNRFNLAESACTFGLLPFSGSRSTYWQPTLPGRPKYSIRSMGTCGQFP